MQDQRPQPEIVDADLEVIELSPLQRRPKPPVTDAAFEIVNGPRPPNAIDKLQALLEGVPLTFWLIAGIVLGTSKLLH